jgi:hypothetical protein
MFETLKRRAIEPLSVEDRSALALRKLFGWGQSVSLPLQQEKASVDPTLESVAIIKSSPHIFMRCERTRCNATILQRPVMHQTDLETPGSGNRHCLSQQQSCGTRAGNRHENRYMNCFFNVVSYKRNAQPNSTRTFLSLLRFSSKGLRFEAY